MRNLLFILTLSLSLLSCGNRIGQERVPSVAHDVLVEEKPQVVDTIKMDEACQKAEETKVPSTPASSCSSRSHKSSNYGNLRGFDPASEDDTEDNGMSRYMENNDEEGWD